MDLRRLLELVDARPFKPFDLDLVNGRTVRIDHPENVTFFPYREKVKEILVYYPEPDDYSVVFPESIAALHSVAGRNGGNGRTGRRK